MRVRAMLLAVVLGMLAGVAHGQSATPASSILWDQAGPDLATVQAFGFKYYADGAGVGVAFPSAVVCTGTVSPFVCKVLFPAFTPGTHTIIVTASDTTVTPALESVKTGTLSFKMVLAPAAPTNLRSGS